MKVLVTGGTGQLGYCLQHTAPATIELIAPGRKELDLSDSQKIAAYLAGLDVDAVINAAAYTAVDKAEEEPELAYQINAEAVKLLSAYCDAKNIPLLQVSTDFVFDGKQSHLYAPTDKTDPLGIYGQTKLKGEGFALEGGDNHYIVRTGWLYCEHGQNFVKTMLRLARERELLSVVADQVGTPTYAANLAKMLWRLLELRPREKVFHFSDAGVASWYDLAQAVFEKAVEHGLLAKVPELKPIPSSEYPTPAERPVFSVLDKRQSWGLLQVPADHWRSALDEMLKKLKALEDETN